MTAVPDPKPDPAPAKPISPSPVIDAAHLFGAAKEVQIELQGVRYRLRITCRGKLILQK